MFTFIGWSSLRWSRARRWIRSNRVDQVRLPVGQEGGARPRLVPLQEVPLHIRISDATGLGDRQLRGERRRPQRHSGLHRGQHLPGKMSTKEPQGLDLLLS